MLLSAPTLPGSDWNIVRFSSKTSQQKQGLSYRSCSWLSAETHPWLPVRSHALLQPRAGQQPGTSPTAPKAFLGQTPWAARGSRSRGAAELASRTAKWD